MIFYFYIISCKDCDFCYIGHAVDLNVRMNLHKHSVTHAQFGKSKLYNTIREFGGWDNWYYEVLFECDCVDERDALKKECDIYDSLVESGWLLNTNRPIRLPFNHPTLVEKRRCAVIKHRQKNNKLPRVKLTEEEYKERRKQSQRKWYEKKKNENNIDSLLKL